MVLDDHEHRRRLRSVGQFYRIDEIVHDIPEFKEMLNHSTNLNCHGTKLTSNDVRRFASHRDVALDFRAAARECWSPDPSGPLRQQFQSRLMLFQARA